MRFEDLMRVRGEGKSAPLAQSSAAIPARPESLASLIW
jgi:hypothetical protein